MIQVDQALSIIAANSCKMPVREIKVSKSLGFILAEAVFSPINMPPFRQSAMDGYAFSHGEHTNFDVIDTIQAGDFSTIKTQKNQAIRIFTGAYVPDSVDTVVMQEHVVAQGNSVEITQMPTRFANVRTLGEQIKTNQLVLDSSTQITPAAIGFLTSLGITTIKVYAKPKVAILVTGNELIKAGKKLPLGKIYESNSVMLKVALEQIGLKKTKIFKVKDTLKATERILKNCLSSFDIILVSGGISVGDYDFVKEALLFNGVEELFYKINQKPGKPLFFGKKGETIVFALPGNPASSLTSFYVYVYPTLKKSMGYEALHLPKKERKINESFTNNSGKSLFLKAFYDDEKVTVLESQSSAMLNTFAVANAFVYLPYDVEKFEKGAVVTVISIL